MKSVAQKIAAGSAAGALVRLTVCLVALAAALWAFAAMPSRATEEDKGVLADLISRALSSEATQVSIGAVDGALSSNASISDIVLSDKDGPWLKIDRVKLVWRRAALVSRRLEVDQLLIHKLEFLRKPTPSDAPAQTDAAPILPELPLKVEIKEFAVGELALGAPILGTSASLSMAGAATLGNPAEGLDLHLDAKRLDAAGAVSIKLLLVPQTKALTLAAKLDEPEGGIVARAASIPGLPAVKLDLDGKGTLDAFKANLAFDAGPTIGATGGAELKHDGAARRLSLDLEIAHRGMAAADGRCGLRRHHDARRGYRLRRRWRGDDRAARPGVAQCTPWHHWRPVAGPRPRPRHRGIGHSWERGQDCGERHRDQEARV